MEGKISAARPLEEREGGTNSDTPNLLCPILDRRVDWRSCVSLGGTAASLGAEMEVDGEKLGAGRCPPMCDEGFAGLVPDATRRFNTSRVEAVERYVIISVGMVDTRHT